MPASREPLVLPPQPTLDFERSFWQAGLDRVAGLDEAGRGAWAGPVYAACAILPNIPRLADALPGVRDSKQLTPHQRELAAVLIRRVALAWGIGKATCGEIDTLGIVPATCLAMRRSLAALDVPPQALLVDYLHLEEDPLPQRSLIKGDARCLSIAAASILAKTARDEEMREWSERYPGYGFEYHKGYGTVAHRRALVDFGITPLHRLCFQPMRTYQVGTS